MNKNSQDRMLAIIPARGGSKGVPNKNIKPLGGSPLIEWTIRAAKSSQYINKVLVTTDSDKIGAVARDAGCHSVLERPPYLASDEARSVDVISNVLENFPDQYEWFVFLQPTSPFRTSQNIDDAFELMLKSKAQSCVSVVESSKSPEWMYWVDERSYSMSPILADRAPSRRQDCRPAYALNGAIYICRTSVFQKSHKLVFDNSIPFIMTNFESLDIDTHDDFSLAEFKLGVCKNAT